MFHKNFYKFGLAVEYASDLKEKISERNKEDKFEILTILQLQKKNSPKRRL